MERVPHREAGVDKKRTWRYDIDITHKYSDQTQTRVILLFFIKLLFQILILMTVISDIESSKMFYNLSKNNWFVTRFHDNNTL